MGYKLLLVDDEKMIREGLSRVIPWERMRIDSVLTAASGREALEIISRERPDILITDISMPGISGHELIERAAVLKPDLRVLVLTGYDSFEYARKCLQLQVRDYLLKPIDEDSLEKSVLALVEEMEQELQQEKDELEERRSKGMLNQRELEDVFSDLMMDQEDRRWTAIQVLETRYAFMQEKAMMTAVLQAQLDERDRSGDAVIFSARSILQICLGEIDVKKRGISVLDVKTGRIILTFFTEKCSSSPVKMLRELKEIMQDESILFPRIALGGVVQGWKNWYRSYHEAVYLLEKEKEKIDEILESGDEKKRTMLFEDVLHFLEREMCGNLGNFSHLMHIYEAFGKAVESYNLTEDYTRECCFQIASAIYFSYREACGEKPLCGMETLLESLEGVNRNDCLVLTGNWIRQILSGGEENHEIIRNARQFIQQNLNQELSVAKLAERFYVSASYFSRLFKKTVGEGCNEYIVRKRMEKAANLLENSSFSAGKIAEMVGYSDANYFSLTFKRFYGNSPTRYRNKTG